jgi:DNA-binding NtrC family response regulator
MTRILVIDDHKEVRAMICMVLRINHFEVDEAESAGASLKVFEGAAFDAAIVDIFLGSASGFDVIASLRERRPDLPVVVISGMTSFDTESHPVELTNVAYLQKPFRPNDLIRAIERAQGEEPAGRVARAVG